MRWLAHVFSMELRSAISYRADFWISFLGTALGELVVAYFLWRSIYAASGAETLGGLSFPAMMLYYSLVPLLSRLVRGADMGFISGEIFDGTLTRYLVYPVPVFPYKFARSLGQSTVYALQVLVALAAFALFVGMPADAAVTPWGIAGGLAAAFGASLVYFLMASTLELVAFWQENVWSLSVLLRLTTALLGGGLIPLALFPEPLGDVLHWLPFAHLISLPVRCVMGQASLAEWLFGLSMMAGWAAVAALICAAVWSRGTRQYAGTGM